MRQERCWLGIGWLSFSLPVIGQFEQKPVSHWLELMETYTDASSSSETKKLLIILNGRNLLFWDHNTSNPEVLSQGFILEPHFLTLELVIELDQDLSF